MPSSRVTSTTSFHSSNRNLDGYSNNATTVPESTPQRNRPLAMFDRRRRRIVDKETAAAAAASVVATTETEPKKSHGGRFRRSNKTKAVDMISDDDEENDPYDSDPGESYRQHCMTLKGYGGGKSCLGVPALFQQHAGGKKKFLRAGDHTVLTAPPSPTSDLGDIHNPLLSALPASLPANLQRVRYSLRSSITDGAEAQPRGPNVMERRELRPNNVQLNVSHWSDLGGRPYMEDR
jgi:hypothetical protein